jgi:putative heme degradation protein
MKRAVLHTSLFPALAAVTAFAVLPATVRADENPVAAVAQTVADDVVEAAHSNPLRRRWAQMSDEERAQFLERRRAQAAQNDSSIRERLQHLSPRQKAHLRKRLANANQPPQRPLPPQAPRRRHQAGGG